MKRNNVVSALLIQPHEISFFYYHPKGFLAAEGTRNQSVLKGWGNTVRDDRRKERLRPREQETSLLLTAGGTLFEIDRRKAALCSS
jgi:hypothetical protein